MLVSLVPIILGFWSVATVALFARYRGRDAALVSMLAGWALLPNASYPAGVFAAPVGSAGSMHALALPAGLVADKASAIGLGCLAGMILFDWPLLRRLRPGPLDLPILAWCLVPLASALSNGLALAQGLGQARHQALAWGVPYLAGRAYLAEAGSLRRLGAGFALAGLAYAPIGLFEFALGPGLYALAYGPHPYQTEGAARPLGYRPLGFLEHGNQLGLWAALAAVAAAWLAASGRWRPVARRHGRAAAAALIGLCVLYQSHGAIVLMAAALGLLALIRRGAGGAAGRPRRAAPAVVAAALLAAALALGLGLAISAGGASPASWRARLRDLASATGKRSFTWRLARSGDYLARAAERPVLGRSRADWSPAPDGRFVNPVNLGLWLHALGMFGVVGLAASTALLVAPAVEVYRWLPPRAWLNPSCAPVALVAVLLLVSLGDSLVNSTVVLPVIAGAGGLNSWSQRRGRGI